MEKFKGWFTVQNLDKAIYGVLVVIALAICVSGHLVKNSMGVLFFLVVLRLTQGNFANLRRGYKPIAIAMATFLAAMLVSAVYGGNPLKVIATNTIFRDAHNLLLVFIIGLCLHERRQLNFLLLMIFLSLLINDGYFFWQSLHGVERPFSFYRGVLLTGAMFYCIILPPLLVKTFEKGLTAKQRMFYIFMILAALVAVLVSGTRGIWLALIPVLLATFFFYERNFRRMFVALALVAVALGGIIGTQQHIFNRVVSIGDLKDQAQSERLLMWQSATAMFCDHPVMGVGLGNYSDEYHTNYISPEAKEPQQVHAHSMYFQFLGETGLFGFAAYAGLFGYIMLWGWRHRHDTFGMIVLTSTTALLLYGATDHTIGSPQAMRLYWLMLAIGMRGAFLKEEDTT